MLAWLQTLPERKRQPNLVFAAARWHGVPAPGTYDGLRAALLRDGSSGGSIRATIMERATQTNEVGRLATLLPAFATLAPGPLALVEVGASAGLCLYPDRYAYSWSLPDGSRHRIGSGPLLRCAVTSGAPPLPAGVPEVASRAGIDLSPVDVTDDEAVRWLECLVWPEQEARRELLHEAVRVARSDPPRIERGDLMDRLPALLDDVGTAAPDDAVVVVFHTAVIAYLQAAERERFAATMASLVEDRRCHWVSNEGPRVLPQLVPPGVEVPHGRFVLAVDGRPVALTHGHGHELDWL